MGSNLKACCVLDGAPVSDVGALSLLANGKHQE